MEKTLYWSNGKLYLLNQLLLPHKIKYFRCSRSEDVVHAIKEMVVRGAPAIGVTAAFGIALAAGERKFSSVNDMSSFIRLSGKKLAATRPTAVNLFWAIKRMEDKLENCIENGGNTVSIRKELENEAKRILAEDIECNKKMGEYGAKLLKPGSVVITHCNAGALATGGYGTALGVIRAAYKKNRIKMVYVDETRPYLQGARLTAWELKQEKIPYRLICDNMSGHIMRSEKIDAVITGADRIASNGDTANKIGTYALAILASYHKIPFYIAAPLSTIDKKIKSGKYIPIEERNSCEVTKMLGKEISPRGTVARHPAFDVTPNGLITAIITEKGIYKKPFKFGLSHQPAS